MLLLNQFHDILCGSSVLSAIRDTEQAFGGVIQDAEQLLNTALRRLAATVAPGPDPAEPAFLVFNLTDTGQQGPSNEPWTGWEQTTYRLLDDRGGDMAYQDLPPENYTSSRSPPHTLCAAGAGVRLSALPLRRGHTGAGAASRGPGDAFLLESARWRLDIDLPRAASRH